MARRYARLPAGSSVLRALCNDSSVYERLCSARAAKVDSLHDLLAAGRAAVLLPPGQRHFASGNTRSWMTLGATASARTHATAHRARPVHIHPRPSHYRSPLLTVLVFRALAQHLPSDIDASSDSGSNGRAARGACVNVCACMCALWAARASGSARENRAQFR